MILIFNTIIDPKAKENFTNTIAKRITLGKQYKVIHVEEEIPDLTKYTHLLISGSELSASGGSDWDEKIILVIKNFLQQKKPILGICHGHQMLARAIAGAGVCRKAAEPEFGWKKMQITSNPLFDGISDPVFLESRYDEVTDLPDEFKIIARNNSTAIQAFQYKDLPVWGVQFHPEMEYEDGSKIVEDHLDRNTGDREFFQDQLAEKTLIGQNFLIFQNFLKYSK
jgi:GMP synthase-like glutamine amidotransferase